MAHPEFNDRLNKYLRKHCSSIISNISSVKEKYKPSYQSMVEQQISNIDSAIERYSHTNNLEYIGATASPPILCKYVPAEYASQSAEYKTVRFSTIDYYKHEFDESEGKIPITADSSLDDCFEIIWTRVMNSYLEEHHLDIDSVFNRSIQALRKNCFVGCFSEKPLSEDMWQKFAGGNGICI